MAPAPSDARVCGMRNLLIATGGLVFGIVLMVALLVALPATTNVTVRSAGPQGLHMPHMAGGMSMVARAVPRTRRLMIQHVLKGCHVWSNGKRTGSAMRLTLKPGGNLSILDQDVDAHQLVQVAGPTRLHIGGPMMVNRGMSVSFRKAGIYRFRTKVVEMPGMTMEAKTLGPDHTLRLAVKVL